MEVSICEMYSLIAIILVLLGERSPAGLAILRPLGRANVPTPTVSQFASVIVFSIS